MKKILFTLVLFVAFNQVVFGENIHFKDNIYKLKEIDFSNSQIKNEYYIDSETKNIWTSMFEITYIPNISNPLKFASETDKKISEKENLLLLKFIQNKKQDIAILSYLESEILNNCAYFIYNILKYEKHPDKGIMALKFAKKYKINKDEDIKNFATEIKKTNDDYMEQIIISPIPPIVKK